MMKMQVSGFNSTSGAPVLLLAIIITSLLQHLFLHYLHIFRAWLTNVHLSQMLEELVEIPFIQIIHKYR